MVLRRPRLLAFAQFAVTGERLPRRLPLLADAIRAGSHDLVVDLGCGTAPLLDFVSPSRYVGVEASEFAVAEARRRHAGAGREFIVADLRDVPLGRWAGVDVAAVSSVMHHLSDAEVADFAARIRDELRPQRLLVQDAEPRGLLGPLVQLLDDGRHLRTRAQLAELLGSQFVVTVLWIYTNPLRSFEQFLLELSPR